MNKNIKKLIFSNEREKKKDNVIISFEKESVFNVKI